jgi:hypothetical protein
MRRFAVMTVGRPAAAVAIDRRPGLDPRRLASLMVAAVGRLELDLAGREVVTEAATGAYGVTAVIAALAGARKVHALAGASRYGTTGQVIAYTRALAAAAGVEQRIEIVTCKRDVDLAEADIVTNSGHLRPLDGCTVGQMKRGAAIPLMYEAWELRPGDVDLDACRERGVRVAGTNERHPAVDVFSFLGAMAVKLLIDAGVAVYSSRLLLLCDNPFRSFIERTLVTVGATVEVCDRFADAQLDAGWDAVLVALRPGEGPVLSGVHARALAEQAPGTIVVQYWGDVDRDALLTAGVGVWPNVAPPPGHMGILPSAVGPEPIVRLQAAGLKVGELLCKDPTCLDSSDLEYLDRV